MRHCKNFWFRIFISLFLLPIILFGQDKALSEIDALIEKGEFRKADSLINYLFPAANNGESYELSFRKDLMNRIRLDFRKSEEDVLNYIKKYYPNVTPDMLRKWETEKSLEMRVIDGERKYFSQAARNFFRINKEAKKLMEQIDGPMNDPLDSFLQIHIPAVIRERKASGKVYSSPQQIKITYTLTVDKNAVPEGEIIRFWLPFPREGHQRQINIQLQSVEASLPSSYDNSTESIKMRTLSPDEYVIAPGNFLQRTLYLEIPAIKDQPTIARYSLTYTALSEVPRITMDETLTFGESLPLFNEFTKEEKPHLVFSDELKALSDKITSGSKNKTEILKRIFTWISNNIPWASALEYSTIKNISGYCIENGHGDCGIQTMLFMTLCRFNGIPARWQSGWMLHPGSLNLHDWCLIYTDQYGWIPVDQSFGIQNFDDPNMKYFYLGNTDNYHFIVNDGYSQNLFPAKVYPRSETVDFQRGEVEWKGGNLYFNNWDYDMKVEFLNEESEK